MSSTPAEFTAADVHRLLDEHESSTLSLAEFARLRGIAPYRLYDARRRRRARRVRESASTVQEVQVVDTTS